MRSANPVLDRLDDVGRAERQVLGVGTADTMTVADVVSRTVGLLLVTVVSGGAAAAGALITARAVRPTIREGSTPGNLRVA